MDAQGELPALRRILAALMAPDAPEVAALPCTSEMVVAHGLGPLCFAAGDRRFHAAYTTAAATALHRDRQLAVLIEALAGCGIVPCLLKGVSYVRTIYEDPALRPMADIDLLIRPDEFAAAVETARGLGYRVRAGDRAPLATPIHHAVPMDHDDWPCPVDLHRAFMGPFRSRLRTEPMWARMQPASRSAPSLRLDPVDETFFHLLHLARAGFIVRAIAYVDAARLSRRLDLSQRQAVRDRARAFKTVRAIDAALAVVEMFRRGEGRPRAVAALIPGADEILARKPDPLPRRHVRQALLTDSPTYLWGYVRAHLLMVGSPRKFRQWRQRVAARRRANR